MRDINLKEYIQLKPQERTNLTLLALARGDFKEADRLSDYCPRQTYSMMDKGYACRMIAIPIIKHLFYEQCVYYYNILVRIDYTILLLEAMPDPSLCEEDSEYNQLHKRQVVCQAKLKAVYQGFMDFCMEAGLDNDAMLKNICVEHSCFKMNEYLDSDIALDQEHTAYVKKMFLECWEF